MFRPMPNEWLGLSSGSEKSSDFHKFSQKLMSGNQGKLMMNFKKTKNTLLLGLSFCLGLAMLASSTLVAAQTYPTKPVKILVPFAAGGPADNYARFMAQRLQEALGQPFVVDDRPGAGSVIGTDAAAKSAPDGYTLLVMSNAHTVNESLIPNKPFQLMRDFVAIAPINTSDLVLVANPALTASNLKGLIDQAKAKPGKINYASSGPGTPYHMAGELFKNMASVSLVHIPYRGSSGARTDVIRSEERRVGKECV